ncbi:MAG: hypothetical protein AVDCRST_MAG64-1453 [uncultured Phycisphaerae bacterium]|uniref:Uncharacterized protein n=1 Tax=uncultured Phycisphaerae bacterium TaxID=904963 RepID=A0A6J4NT02_9BACT|nr:MAG: hypothetical protein AVDCRST_MAG64-1453 [uncultured Phycisphaerae bacterium]
MLLRHEICSAAAVSPAVRACLVEHGDHDHGAEVVHDRDGEQKHLHRGRHVPADEREHADRERDVDGHRHGPTGGTRPAAVQGEEDEGRRDHAPDRRRERQARGAQRRELAEQHLALIAKPTSRKKTTIRPSFTQCSSDIACENPAVPTLGFVCQKSW